MIGTGSRARFDAVQALVVEVRHERDALVDAVRAAAVLVHRRRTLKPSGTTSTVSPSGSRLTRTTCPPRRAPLEPPDDAVLQPRRGQPDAGRATISAEIGDDHVPYAATVSSDSPGAPTAAAMVLRHAADPRAGVGNAHAVHEERGAPAHALAVEASVGFYARRDGEDEELWRATALLHDFDYEIHPTLDKHPQDGAPILREEGYPEELIDAVLSHAEHLAMPRDTQLKKVLFACDELSGFVHACGLVRPTGLDGLEPKSVRKKLKQPSFAAGVHRDEVYAGAELLGLELDEHITNVVTAMQPIAGELGLRTAADAA